MQLVFRALNQILKNQRAIMECLYSITMIMSRNLEPYDKDDLRACTHVLVEQYNPTSARSKELQEVK